MELTDLTTFKDLNLAAPLLQVLGEEGYDTPTPIQAGAIPELMAGRDLIGIAQTGTGKAAAFLLPILHRHVLEGKKLRPAKKSGRVIVLAPTRELAAQIHDSAKTYARHMRIFMTTITGGVKQGPQVRAIASGVDLLIATPGRLLDLHEQGPTSSSRRQAGCLISSTRTPSTCPASRCSCSTRPTRCSTSASCRR